MGGCGLTGVTLNVTAEQFNAARRLMGVSTLEAIRLIHVRAAHMTVSGCPVKTMQETPRPSSTAHLVEGTNKFRVVVGHVLAGRHGEQTAEVQVDASFELLYSLPKDISPVPTPEELQAFADTNALLNCWPYWRELVHDMVARMELPPLLLPLFRLTTPPTPTKEPTPVAPTTAVPSGQ